MNEEENEMLSHSRNVFISMVVKEERRMGTFSGGIKERNDMHMLQENS